MKLKKIIRYYLMRLFYLLRDRRRLSIFFESFSGQYSDSPRAISEAVHKMNSNIELIWEGNEIDVFPEYVKVVKSRSLKKIRAMAQAKVWVTHGCGSKESGFWKGRDVLSIATWHGDRGFKKIGYAAANAMKDSYHHFKELPNYCDTDYITVGSDYGIRQAREGLGYYGELLCHGLPRNDKLVRINDYADEIQQIKSRFDVAQDVKVLLFAPTFRDNVVGQPNIVDLNSVLKSISSDGNKWIILARVHNHVKQHKSYNDKFIKDVSHIGDMADLLLIADCLITDYSSSAGDFILTGKPCVLAQFDRELYENESRSLAFDPDISGFLIAKNQKELDDILLNLNNYDHKTIAKKVLDFYGTFESGKSADYAANTILSWLNLKETI